MYVRTYGDAKSAIGIAIDAEGYSFVSENSGLCLSIFDPQGSKIHAHNRESDESLAYCTKPQRW